MTKKDKVKDFEGRIRVLAQLRQFAEQAERLSLDAAFDEIIEKAGNLADELGKKLKAK